MIAWISTWTITEWVIAATVIPGGIAVLTYFEMTPRSAWIAIRQVTKARPVPESKPVWPIHAIGLPVLSRKVLGRETELADLRAALIARGEAAILPGAVVQGQGGLGKSTLAAFYAERFKGEYHGILWVAAEAGPAQGICAAGPALGVAVAGLAPGEAAKAVLAAMAASGQPWLVVYDNVSEAKALAGFVPQGGAVHLIVTTRQGYGWDGYGVIRAGMLGFDTEDGAAVRVLMQAAERKDGAAEARALAADLGGLPLALVVAGALIKESGEGFAAYRGRLAEIIRERPPGDYPDSVFGAVKLSYSSDRLGADARAVLDLFAWFAAEGLEARLLTEVPGEAWVERFRDEIGAELLGLAADAGRVAAALRDLQRAALLSGAAGGPFALHRLTGLAVRGMQPEPNEVARAAAAVLKAVYPGRPDVSDNWKHCRRLTPHVAALLDSGVAPATAAMDGLLNQASIYLTRMAETAQSLRFAREALRLTAARLPEAGREIALGHANLGVALQRSGDPAGAERETARAVALDEVHRPGSEDLADSYDLHGQALQALDRLPAALRRAQQALALRRQRFGRWHDDVALSLNNLGRVRRAMGRPGAALRLYAASLTIRRRVLPPGDARLGFALLNTGSVWLRMGRAEVAEPLLEEALALREAVHDRADHPDRRTAAGWLISCLLVRAAAGENAGLREARAKVLCAAYGFGFAEMQAQVPNYPYRPGGGA